MRLNTDEVGVVTHEHPTDPFRPQVKVAARCRPGSRSKCRRSSTPGNPTAAASSRYAVVEAVDPDTVQIDPLALHVTMADPATTPTLAPEAAAKFAEFARACKAAARAVALYPGSHPAIGTSLSRLAQATARLTEGGPFRLQVRADTLLLDGALAAKPDPAIAELADVLYRHLIGALTVNAGADAESWRTLLLLLARTPEEVRADGGIAHLWAHGRRPEPRDRGNRLRRSAAREAGRRRRRSTRSSPPRSPGRQLQLDDSAMRALVDIVGDPAKLDELMAQLETADGGPAASTSRPPPS